MVCVVCLSIFLKKKPFADGIGIYQERWVNFVIADTLASRIASPLVATVLIR